eukprot:10350081-Ditylum_brightwellii.AAC.1
MPSLNVPHIPNDDISEVIRDAVEDQQVIGWDNFMKGRISNKWKVAQGMFKAAMPTYKNFDR